MLPIGSVGITCESYTKLGYRDLNLKDDFDPSPANRAYGSLGRRVWFVNSACHSLCILGWISLYQNQTCKSEPWHLFPTSWFWAVFAIIAGILPLGLS
jgi:hypothetical protein